MDHIPPPPIAQAPNAVEHDTPCRRCGYNLRGLPVGGQCPECAAPIGLSLFGNLLRYASPSYVRTLQRGFTLIMRASCAALIGLFGVSGAMLVLSSWVDLPASAVAAAVAFGVLGVYVVVGIGHWLITVPDPAGIGAERHAVSRWIARLTLIIGLAGCAHALRWMVVNITPGAVWMSVAFSDVARLAIAASLFAHLYYVSWLAGRFPAEKPARRARHLMYALPILVSVSLLGSLLERLGCTGAGVTLQAIATLSLMIFIVIYLALLERMRLAMVSQAELSQRLSAAGPGGASAMP